MLLACAPRIRFVLVAPSHAGNIGAAARALKVMGFDRLTVVDPRQTDFKSHEEALARAVGAADVVQAAAVFSSLPEALAGVRLAYAMTGYAREFGPPLTDLRSAAQALDAELVPPGDIAFVFGTERSGLTNEDAERCQRACAIAANPDFGSLNLAQAVQVTAYECRRALAASAQSERIGIGPSFTAEPTAPVEQIEAMIEHWRQALAAIGYFNPHAPKRLLSRLRRLFNRAQPTASEIDLLRGVAAAMIAPKRERAGAKKRTR